MEALLALERGETIAHVGTWTLSLAGSPTMTWSPECYRLFGMPPNTRVTVEDCFARIHPSDRQRVRALHRATQVTGDGYQVDYRVVPPDSAVRWLRTNAIVEKDASGRPVRVVGVCQDITEHKRTHDELRASEAQLRHAQKMEIVGRLVGGIVHDFNNALSVVGTHAALALDDLPSGHPLRADLDQILSATELAKTLARQLLAFSRRQPAESRTIDLNATVRNVEKMTRSILGNDIAVQLHLTRGEAEVYADPGQLEQVLMNLLINARDAMPSGGALTIETAEVDVVEGTGSARADIHAGAYIRLSVTDSGVGMDQATQARIFEPFFTTKDADRGTGLGLSTVRGIVEHSGGHISVSSAPDEGTRFEILLPRMSKAEVQSPTSVPSSPGYRKPAGLEALR